MAEACIPQAASCNQKFRPHTQPPYLCHNIRLLSLQPSESPPRFPWRLPTLSSPSDSRVEIGLWWHLPSYFHPGSGMIEQSRTLPRHSYLLPPRPNIPPVLKASVVGIVKR